MSCSARRLVLGVALSFATSGLLPAQEWLDAVSDAMTVQSPGGLVRARVSGSLELEGYRVEMPPPGLITTDHELLFNPRLIVMLDVQVGGWLQVFAQGRADRGFDPSDHEAEVRLEEYALSLRPGPSSAWRVQAGRFATVLGGWVRRHDAWSNPFVTAPVPYEAVTPVYDGEVPASREVFLEGREHASESYDRVPLVWGPAYTSGLAVFAQRGRVDAALEFKNAAPCSRPEVWDGTAQDWSHPTWSGRLGWSPNEMWNVGLSGSAGSYLRGDVPLVRDGGEYEESDDGPALPRGRGWGDYRQYLVAQDVSFSWRHWQVWAEAFAVRYEVPRVGDADTFAYFVEAKYKFDPQWFAALRWNQQVYAEVDNGEGGRGKWGNDLWRADAAVTWRATTRQQLKVQYSLIDATRPGRELQHFWAAQWTVRF